MRCPRVPGLPPQFLFAVGGRISGCHIVGEVLTQDRPWTLTVQQKRGGRITAATDAPERD